MPISSMTGYARADGTEGGYRWTWDIRSVNGKGLDVRTRLPSGFDGLDGDVKKGTASRLRRGNVNVSLQINRESIGLKATINEELLGSILSLRKTLGDRVSDAPPSLEALLAVRGLVELVEDDESPEARERLESRLLESLLEAVESLASSRNEEGRRIEAILGTLLVEIDANVAAARDLAALRPAALRERLQTQIAEILDASPALSEERLMQEAAILATKGDIREELDRLHAHVQSARDLLADAEPVGRRLEFLCQELNREANTLCSKSSDLELTRIGLSLKSAIDQVREQVLNVE